MSKMSIYTRSLWLVCDKWKSPVPGLLWTASVDRKQSLPTVNGDKQKTAWLNLHEDPWFSDVFGLVCFQSLFHKVLDFSREGHIYAKHIVFAFPLLPFKFSNFSTHGTDEGAAASQIFHLHKKKHPQTPFAFSASILLSAFHFPWPWKHKGIY